MPLFRHVDFQFEIPDTWWFKPRWLSFDPGGLRPILSVCVGEMAEFRPKAQQYRANPSNLKNGQTILSVCVGEVEPLRSRKLNAGPGLGR